MSSTMTQCCLKHSDGRIDTRWIETKFSKLGSTIKVKTTKENWKIIEIGSTWPTSRVLSYERDYVNMPLMTDSFNNGNSRSLPIKPR